MIRCPPCWVVCGIEMLEIPKLVCVLLLSFCRIPSVKIRSDAELIRRGDCV